jgi:hypothetical protein
MYDSAARKDYRGVKQMKSKDRVNTDYFYKAVNPKSKLKWLARSAIMPISAEGAWQNI